MSADDPRSDAQPTPAPKGATLLLDRLRREGEPTDRCSCGNPATCVGQFEGELAAMVACDDCCVHVDYGECGRCFTLPDGSDS